MPRKYVSVTDTAKLVREALKKEFPGVVFGVRSKSYAGGASITVRWTDGPSPRQVQQVTSAYEGATFDSMIDLKSYVDSTDADGNAVHYGADYIFEEREFSNALTQTVAALAAHYYSLPVPTLNAYGWYDDTPGLLFPVSIYDHDNLLDKIRQWRYVAVWDGDSIKFVGSDQHRLPGELEMIQQHPGIRMSESQFHPRHPLHPNNRPPESPLPPVKFDEGLPIEADGTDPFMIENQRGLAPGEDWLTHQCALCGATATSTHQEWHLCAPCRARVQAYADRLESRVARLRTAAAKVNADAQRDYNHAHQMADSIPFGQPILVGHYSEGRDRRYRARIHDTFGRAFAKMEKAQQLRRRAEAAETNRAISSDDPAAVLKLQTQFEGLQAAHQKLLDANKYIREANKRQAPLPEMMAEVMRITGCNAWTANYTLAGLYSAKVGDYRTFQTTNSSAGIRRLEQRIAELQAKAAQRDSVVIEEQHDAITLERDPDANRLRIHFPGKPAAAVITALKAHGFHWSPTNKAWQRQLNAAAESAAQQILILVKRQP